MKTSIQSMLIFLFLFQPILLFAQSKKVPAFYGAEGFGKYTKGGRGGEVYLVTTLDDAGPGSLREGIESARAPRTIVFEIGGTIMLESPLIIKEKSHLTIAGQTAPGKGITIRDHQLSIKDSWHIIVRYLRIRLGDENKGENSQQDVMEVNYNDHVILDHLSLSWGIDGNSDYRGNSNMTLQWLIYSEALNGSLHDKGDHAMCTSLRDCRGNTSVHHNIYATSRNRHPTLGSGVSKVENGAQYIVDFRNNLNYNWKGETNLGGLKMNVVGNYYRPGPNTDPSEQPMRIKDHDSSKAQGFMNGNFFEYMPPSFTRDNYQAVNYTNTGKYMSTTREKWEVSREFDCGEFFISQQTALDAYEACLNGAGCSLVRDDVDLRVIESIREQKGDVIDSQNDVGGWDEYPVERRPEGWDTDRDGMPDEWERMLGLNPNDPDDRNKDYDRDGFTILEEYLDSLCAKVNQ